MPHPTSCTHDIQWLGNMQCRDCSRVYQHVFPHEPGYMAELTDPCRCGGMLDFICHDCFLSGGGSDPPASTVDGAYRLAVAAVPLADDKNRAEAIATLLWLHLTEDQRYALEAN